MTEKSIGKFSFSPFAIFSLLAAIILKLPKWISKLYITLKYLPRRWHKSGQDSTSEEREHAHIHPIKYFIHASTDTGSLCINKSVENQEDRKKNKTKRDCKSQQERQKGNATAPQAGQGSRMGHHKRHYISAAAQRQGAWQMKKTANMNFKLAPQIICLTPEFWAVCHR